jgi:hypothetical protein
MIQKVALVLLDEKLADAGCEKQDATFLSNQAGSFLSNRIAIFFKPSNTISYKILSFFEPRQ